MELAVRPPILKPDTPRVAEHRLRYTVYSEYLNTVVRGAWAYTEWMPTVPWLGTGLSPLAQWLIIPTVTLIWAGRTLQLGVELRQEAYRRE